MNNHPFFNLLQSKYRQGLRNNRYRWLIVLGTFAYLASPIDIAPDILPGIGWIDDGIIATLFVSEMSQLMIEKRKMRRQAQPQTTTAQSADVIDVNAAVL